MNGTSLPIDRYFARYVLQAFKRVLGVNSVFGIKNPNFIISFKEITKLGNDRHCE